MRYLVVGSAVDVIEYWTRESSLGQMPKIMKVVTVAQHSCLHPELSQAWEDFLVTQNTQKACRPPCLCLAKSLPTPTRMSAAGRKRRCTPLARLLINAAHRLLHRFHVGRFENRNSVIVDEALAL
jgi:hypothetical protein